MPITIAVVKDSDSKTGWKVLENYIQRGVTLHGMEFANNEATKYSETINCDHLILAKAEA